MTDVTTQPSYTLMRAQNGRMLGGIAAGLAKASGLDVTIVRICLGLTVLSFGLGIPAYILMWVVLPEEAPKRGRVIEPAPENIARTIRMVIMGVAALSVLNQLGGFWPVSNPGSDGFGWGGVFGLILLGIGVSVLFSRHRPDRVWWEPSSPPSPSSTAPRRPAPPAGDDDDAPTYVGPLRDVMAPVTDAVSQAFHEVRTTFAEARPARPARPASPAPGYVDDDYDDYDDYRDYDAEYDDYAYEPPPAVAMVTSDRLDGSSGGAALGWARVVGWFCLIWWTLAAIGVTAAWAIGAVSLNRPVVLAVASWLVFTAVLNTLLHAKFARAIIPTLALLLVPIAIGGATVRPVGGVGHVISEPPTVAEATKNYRQAVGRLDLNYTDTAFERRATTVNARVGIGAIFVEVPDNATVIVNTKAQIGGYEIFGRRSDGTSANERTTFDGCEGGPKLTLNLRTGVGFIQVHRDNGKRDATCTKAA